jgi:hypothetical protein
MAEYGNGNAPVEQDIRHDDLEHDPTIEPQSAKAWLNLLRESEDAFEDWNLHCERIDQHFASLMRLGQLLRDKEFQMFWANMEVVKPAIYAKPPVPVVVPKFKDRRPVYQAASELAERCAVVSFDLAEIDELMKLVRDDLALISRGVAWCRYESGEKGSYYDHEKVCVDFKGRRDFLHSISRNWREVTWVAGASYLTRAEARERFKAASGDEYQSADYKVDRDAKEIGGTDARQRGKFWEIWDRSNKRVVWVAEGCENILDDADPHLKLRNFFPCPKPAYGAVQRGSLVPVPDALQYKDQLEEINLLTGRIHALSDAIEVKGFYPAGGSELAEAVQTAVSIKTPGRVLVPISNWAAFGGTKDVIIWMPIDMIATTITGLVALRKQVIDDIYQITGLADIMRGDTDPTETLGAQQLKTQYGSTRIRDKQQELVRLARDLVEISLEIMIEKFDDETLVEMSQTQLPTTAMIERQGQQLMMQIQQAQQQVGQMQPQAAQSPSSAPVSSLQGPDPAQAAAQAAQNQIQQLIGQLNQLQQQPTIEQVLDFLRDNQARAFVLDIETDSTIMADENGEKQRRTEFVGMLGQLIPQLGQLIAADPQSAQLCGDILKFATAPYRAGRSLDGSIDEYVEHIKTQGAQGKGDDATTATNKTLIQVEQIKQQTAQQKIQMDAQYHMAQLQQNDNHKQMELANQRQLKQMELSAQAGDSQAEMAVQAQKMQESREAHQAQLLANQQKMALERQKAEATMRAGILKAQQPRPINPQQGPI